MNTTLNGGYRYHPFEFYLNLSVCTAPHQAVIQQGFPIYCTSDHLMERYFRGRGG